MYKVNDVFTTQDGEWYVSDKEYSIDKEHLDKYSNEDIPQKGAATHLIARVPSGARVKIVNRYNNEVVKDFTSVGVWFDFPMGKSSAYKPDKGETGPWNLVVDGELLLEGVGLPYSHHISTFVDIVKNNQEQPEIPGSGPTIPEEPGQPVYVVAVVTLYSDGSYRFWQQPQG